LNTKTYQTRFPIQNIVVLKKFGSAINVERQLYFILHNTPIKVKSNRGKKKDKKCSKKQNSEHELVSRNMTFALFYSCCISGFFIKAHIIKFFGKRNNS